MLQVKDREIRMKCLNTLIGVGLFILCLSVQANDAQELTSKQSSYIHQGKLYPPVFFINHIPDSDFKDFKNKMQALQAFEDVNDDIYGSPIGVRVWVGNSIQADATSFTSVLISSSLLGLTPVVSNELLRVKYQVLVQGEVIDSMEYEFNHTDAEMIWNLRKEQKLGPDETSFVYSTIPLFFKDLAQSTEAKEVFEEYYEFFGES